MDDERWLIHIDGKNSRVEPEKLSRRHLTLTPSALVRLLMGHTGITAASDEEGFIASTSTALDAARILFQPTADLAQPARQRDCVNDQTRHLARTRSEPPIRNQIRRADRHGRLSLQRGAANRLPIAPRLKNVLLDCRRHQVERKHGVERP